MKTNQSKPLTKEEEATEAHRQAPKSRRNYHDIDQVDGYLNEMAPHAVTLRDISKALTMAGVVALDAVRYMIEDGLAKVVGFDPNEGDLFQLIR